MTRTILFASVAVLAASAAQASHFRGATLVPSVDPNGLLSVQANTFWRPSAPTGVNTLSVDGGATSVQEISRNVDTTDIRRDEVNEVWTAQLPGAGTYNMSFSNCCWVAGVPNASSSYGTSSTIVWDGSTANAPINFALSNIQQEVPRSVAYSDNLGVTGPHSYTYDDTVLSTGMNGQPTGYDIDSGGTISMPQSATSAISDNGSNDGADIAFSGRINSDDGSSVNFVWVFDATDNAPDTNNAPSVGDVTVNAVIGDAISETITATDPDGDMVSMILTGFSGPGGAVGNGMFTDDGDDTGLFTWDSTGFMPGTYIALIQGSDGFLTDTGQVTVNLSAQSGIPPIPLPASVFFVLAGIGALGGLKLRRKS